MGIFKHPTVFVWDLMHTPDGVKILEFQLAKDSDFLGWETLTGEDLKEIIAEKTADFAKTDTCNVLNAICDSKAMAATFTHGKIGNLEPNQKVYSPTLNDFDTRQKIVEGMTGATSLALKTPTDATGTGVSLISITELSNLRGNSPRTLRKMFAETYLRKPTNMDLAGLTMEDLLKIDPATLSKLKVDDNYAKITIPNKGQIVAQEGMIPLPIENDKGKFVHPTMRVVATVAPKEDGSVEWDFHAGYYKMPASGYDSLEEAEQSRISLGSRDKFMSKIKAGGAKFLEDDTYDRVKSELVEGLNPFLEELAKMEDASPIINDALQSENEGDHVSAAVFLANDYRMYSDNGEHIDNVGIRTKHLLEGAVEKNPLLLPYIAKYTPEIAKLLDVGVTVEDVVARVAEIEKSKLAGEDLENFARLKIPPDAAADIALIYMSDRSGQSLA